MKHRAPLIFGTVDGTVLIIGILAGMLIARQSVRAVGFAGVGAGLAELGGMTLAQYWSSKEDGFAGALVNGAAAGASAVVPALLCIFLRGATALWAAGALVALISGFICWLRPERGWQAVMRTYGLLAVVGVLSGLSGLL